MLASRWTQKPPVGTPLDASHDLAAGLVGAWAFNEGTGGTVHDLAGGLSAPLVGGVSWGVGASGGPALTFDGITDYLGPIGTTGTYSFVQNTQVFSLAARARITGAGYSTLIATNPGASAARGFAWYYNAAGPTLELWLSNGAAGGAYQIAATATAALGPAWHHLAVTGAGAGNTIVMYLDGAPLAVSYPKGFSGLSSGDSTNAPAIGWDEEAGVDYLGGLIDHLLVYSRTLAPAEVMQLATAPWQAFRPQLNGARLYAARSGPRVSYPRGSSMLRPAQLPTADLYCYLD